MHTPWTNKHQIRETGSMGFWNRRHQLGLAAVIMAGSIFVSRFMGLIRDKIISYLFGATSESDVYFAAFVIPDFINYLLAGAYFSITLIPLLAEHFNRDRDDGWRLFSTVLTWVALAITALTAIGMIFARQMAHFAAPGLSPEGIVRLAYFLRIILPAQICFLLGSCFMSVLYLRKQFFVPALVPIVYNLSIIVGGVLLRSRGMEGFCWGVLAGAFLGNLALPILAARQGDGLVLRFSLAHPGMKRFLWMALPLMIGQSIVVLDEQLVRIFGSLAGVGAISWLNYARRIMLVPVGVVAQAAGVASYPFLAELSAAKDYTRFHQTLNSALRNVLTLLVPLSVWMMTVAEPTIQLIFQQGHFNAADSVRTAHLLQVFLIVVFCWGYQQILGRAFYATQDTITPAVLGTLTTVVSIPVFYGFTSHFGVMGVALASATSIALYSAVLSLRWHNRFGSATFTGLLGAMGRLCLLSSASSLPALFIGNLGILSFPGHPYVSALTRICASGFLFFSVFLFLARRFTPDLIRPFLSKVGPIGRWIAR